MRIFCCLKLALTGLSILMATSTVAISQRQLPAPAPSIVPRWVDLNFATKQQLMTLEGVNAEIAEQIVRGRPYKSAAELKERKVVDEAVYDKIKTRVIIPPQPRKLLLQIA